MRRQPDHTPLWLESCTSPGYPALDRDLEVDVAIIGGGITGLTAALELRKTGLTVAVLEQRAIAGGMSGHTTAHLTQAFDTGLTELTRTYSDDAARTIWEAGRTAINHIERIAAAENIPCDFQRVPGYYFAADARAARDVRKEMEEAHRLGFGTAWESDAALPPMLHGAMRIHNQARFHPTRYLVAIAALFKANGGHIFEQTHVTKVRAGTPALVEANERLVRAWHVIYATHQPIHNPFFTTKVPAYQTYAIGLRVPKGAYADILAWDTEEPYHYWRLQPGADHDTLIVGGEDHRTGQDDDTLRHYANLEAYVSDSLGAKFPVTHRWTGQWLEPVDGLPFIGRKHGTENEYLATGFSGNGMTLGPYAGLLITDLILQREQPAANLFDPARLNVRAGAVSFVTENAAFPAHLVGDRLAHTETQDALIALKPGEGQVVSMQGEKVAAFRDAEGQLKLCSATCTHMGCLVHFNAADTSWDCPCHGSRFDVNGEVLAGPATRALAPIDAERLAGESASLEKNEK